MDSDLEQGPPELARLRAKRALWRVASWGMLAACALTGTVLIAQTDVGEQRLRMALAPQAVVPIRSFAQTDTAPDVSPNKEAEALRQQTQQLEAQVRVLAADRDRLVARVASLESNVNSMTGAIRRELKILAPVTPSEPPPVIEKPEVVEPLPESASPAASDNQSARVGKSQARFENHVDVKTEKNNESFAKSSDTSEKPKAAPPVKSTVIESVPLPPVRVASAPSSEPSGQSGKPELALDLGGAHTLEILNARWIAVKANFGPLIQGMHPLVAHDRRPNAIPFRLIVGPVGNGAAAAALCQRFAASRVTCRTTRYVGDALAAAAQP
ncbi:MAG TPA: hypothetical protein VFC54_07385 [Pseudolabrys sp.]|nr:hypothetical protein [Pseudolabrys sp.]